MATARVQPKRKRCTQPINSDSDYSTLSELDSDTDFNTDSDSDYRADAAGPLPLAKANAGAFACNHCEKTFNRRANLVRHMHIHDAVKRFPCTQCSKRFTERHHLEAHRRVHASIRPFVCPQCNHAFSDRSNCARHIQTHGSLVVPSSSGRHGRARSASNSSFKYYRVATTALDIGPTLAVSGNAALDSTPIKTASAPIPTPSMVALLDAVMQSSPGQPAA